MEVHQILPGFCYGDAISDEALRWQSWLDAWEIKATIYAESYSKQVAHLCRPIEEYAPRLGSITIYHYSIGSEDLTERFLQSPGKRMLVYHNITPARFLEPYHEADARKCRDGRLRLAQLANAVDLALGDSEYNCQELADVGFAAPRVLPIAVDFGRFSQAIPCAEILDRYNDAWVHFLFVGRIAPNKRIDDVIRTFAYYNQRVNRRSRLFLVGSPTGWRGHSEELRQLVSDMDLGEHITFTGHVRFEELLAYYRLADIFLCLSDHEGFCVPLLEAAHEGIPILAHAAGAIPDTLGDAGLLFRSKAPAAIAECAQLVLKQKPLRERIVQRQKRRLADFEPEQIARQFRSYLEEVAGS